MPRHVWIVAGALLALVLTAVGVAFLLSQSTSVSSTTGTRGPPPRFDPEQVTVDAIATLPWIGSDGHVRAVTVASRAADYQRWGTGFALSVEADGRSLLEVEEYRLGRGNLGGMGVVAIVEPSPGVEEALVVGRANGVPSFAFVPLSPPASSPAWFPLATDDGASRAWETVEHVIALAGEDGAPEVQLLVRDFHHPGGALRRVRLAGAHQGGRWTPSRLASADLPIECRSVKLLGVRTESLPREAFAIAKTLTGIEVLRLDADGGVQILERSGEWPIPGHDARVRASFVDAAFRPRARPFQPQRPGGTLAPIAERLEEGLPAVELHVADDATPTWFEAWTPAAETIGFFDRESVRIELPMWHSLDSRPWLSTTAGVTRVDFAIRKSLEFEPPDWIAADALFADALARPSGGR